MTTPPAAALAGVPSDKLIKPLNAPRAAAVSPGVQPGVNNGITLAQYVVVFGTSGGVFIYAGSPAPGNPPVYWMGNVTADPYGNALDQGIWAGQPGSIQVGIQTSGAGPTGNAEIFFRPAGAFADDATIGVLQTAGQAILVISGAQTTASGPQSDRIVVNLWDHGAGTSAAYIAAYFDATNTQRTLFNGNYAGLAIPLCAGINAVEPGTGTSSTNAAQGAQWHNISLDANWSTIGGYGAPQYRLLPTGSVQLSGDAQYTGSPGNPQALNSGSPLPAAFNPSANRYYRSGDSHRMGIQAQPNGIIMCYPVSGGTNQIDLEGTYAL